MWSKKRVRAYVLTSVVKFLGRMAYKSINLYGLNHKNEPLIPEIVRVLSFAKLNLSFSLSFG